MIENGGWTPSDDWDLCKGGHPPQSTYEEPDGTVKCGRCGRLIDQSLCGCGTPGHEALSRSFCPVMMQRDQMAVQRAVWAESERAPQPVEKPVEGHLGRALSRVTTSPDDHPGLTLASAVDEVVAARHEARERVRAYVEERARGVEFHGDVIARTYPPGGAGVDAIPLLLSDLQLLIEET